MVFEELLHIHRSMCLGLKDIPIITQKDVKTKVIIPSQLGYGLVGDDLNRSPYTPFICKLTIPDK